jgi:hypothetical protein
VTLEALGNIGDFVGGIAVIITLVYLALQVRQNTQQIRHAVLASQSTSYHESAQQGWEAILEVAKDPEFARLLATGSRDLSALSEDERIRMLALFSPILSSLEIQLHLYESGQIHPELWDMAFLNSAPLLSSPGFLELVRMRRGPLSDRLYELLRGESAA